jgi:hypothetical protein
MDLDVFNLVQAENPQFNRSLAEGYAVTQLENNELYIDKVWRQVEMSFPPNLKYLGYRRVTPQEEFRAVSMFSKQSKRIYDVAKNDVYLVQYLFSLNGEEVKDVLYVYLPYVTQGGIMNIKNSKYVISPVIADIALSVCSDSIFLAMNRAKLTARQAHGYITVDGIRRSAYMVYSQIYNTDARSKAKKNNITTLPHYLFCKFGLTESFRKVGVDIRVINRKYYNPEEFPEAEYVMCTTAEQHLYGRNARYKEVTDIAIMIPRSQWTQSVESMVACFFFVADKFPSRITVTDYDSTTLWRVLLGKFILTGSESEGKILTQINTHMASVDGYVDNMARELLIADGYRDIHDIYDLLYKLIEILPKEVAEVGKKIASLYGKRLVVHRYLNEDITQGISRILFATQKECNTKKDLTQTDLKRIFRYNLPYTAILSLNAGKAFVKSVSSASDCLVHKVTSVTTMQTECGKKGSKKGPSFGESQYADVSIAELGGITNLPDRDPTGRSSLNMCALTDADGTLLQNPEHMSILGAAHEDIRRR